jgi:hypothetical protein
MRPYTFPVNSVRTPEKVQERLRKLWEKIDAKAYRDYLQKSKADKSSQASGAEAPPHPKGTKAKRKTLLILPCPERVP